MLTQTACTLNLCQLVETRGGFMAVKRARQSCGMVMLLLQDDALVVVVFMGVGACPRVRGGVCDWTQVTLLRWQGAQHPKQRFFETLISTCRCARYLSWLGY